MYLKYMVLCTYIGNARVRSFPMYYYSGFSRRYIGIKISMPIPMYEGPIPSKKYIGMGQYRPFPMYRLKSHKQNTSEIQVFFQSRCIPINFPRVYLHPLAAYSRASQPQLISREYTCIPSQHTPAQAGLTMICAEIRLEFEVCGNAGCLI